MYAIRWFTLAALLVLGVASEFLVETMDSGERGRNVSAIERPLDVV